MGGDIAAWCALQRLAGDAAGPDRRSASRRPSNAPMSSSDAALKDPSGAGGHGPADARHQGPWRWTGRRGDRGHLRKRRGQAGDVSQLEPRMQPDALLATNTSSIPLEELSTGLSEPGASGGPALFQPGGEDAAGRSGRGGTTTADAWHRAGLAFTRRIDRLPLPVSSTPGFLVNRMLHALSAGGGRTGEPRAYRRRPSTRPPNDFGMPMGPIELADTVGLDICLHVGEILAGHFGRAVPDASAPTGRAGPSRRKSGRRLLPLQEGQADQSRGRRRTQEQRDYATG